MSGQRNATWQSSLSIMPQSSESLNVFSSMPLTTTSSVMNIQASEAIVSTSPTVPRDDVNVPSASIDPPRLSVKFPDFSATSSSSEEDNDVSQAADVEENSRKSPPPNCAICLGRCKNKCFTDSCMHQFCFKCLCEWSKVKPECPLCKQNFKAIIHNVKSMDQFEEYFVEPPVQQRQEHSLQWRLQSGYTTARFDLYFEEMIMNHATIQALTNEARPRLSFRTGQSSSTDPAVSAGNYGRAELLNLYGEEYSESVNSNYLSQLWRRYIYDRKLFALPVCDVTGRFRESSSRFYRDNPAQMQRLMPWINRDIRCLLRNTEHSVSNILDLIADALKICNILSPAFRRRLQPFLILRTSHFIHELNNFARSPYDMIGYDRVVQYSPQSAEEIFIDYSSSSSSENGVNLDGVTVSVDESDNGNGQVVTSRQANETNGTSGERSNTTNNASGLIQPMNIMSFAVSSTTEGTETTTITSTPVRQRITVITPPTLQGGAINLSTHNRQSAPNDVYGFLNIELFSDDERQVSLPDSNSNSLSAPTPRMPINNIDPVILSLSSSDSECEFVLEQKPPHLRTPELVSLNSESDSDVVFVNETANQELSTTTPKLAPQNKSRRFHRRHSFHACTFSTTSDSDESKDEETKHQNRPTKKLKLSDDVAITKPVLEEQYNVGASTSKGLQNNCNNRRNSNRSLDKRRRSIRLKRKISISRNILLKPHRRCRRSEKTHIFFEESTDDNNDDSSDEDQPLIRFCRYQPKKDNNSVIPENDKQKVVAKSYFKKRSNKSEVNHSDQVETSLPSPAAQSNELYPVTEQNNLMTLNNFSQNNQGKITCQETEIATCNNGDDQKVRISPKLEVNTYHNSQPKTDSDSQEQNQCTAESTDSETTTSLSTHTDSDSSSLSSMCTEYKKESTSSATISPHSSQNSSTMASPTNNVNSQSQQTPLFGIFHSNPATYFVDSHKISKKKILKAIPEYTDSD